MKSVTPFHLLREFLSLQPFYVKTSACSFAVMAALSCECECWTNSCGLFFPSFSTERVSQRKNEKHFVGSGSRHDHGNRCILYSLANTFHPNRKSAILEKNIQLMIRLNKPIQNLPLIATAANRKNEMKIHVIISCSQRFSQPPFLLFSRSLPLDELKM